MDTVETGVPGLDTVLAGGVPRGALVLVVGPTGAGKTILASQIVFHHARQGRRALVLTALTEASSKLISHLSGLDYFDAGLLGDDVRILNVQRMLTDKGLDATLDEVLKSVVARKIEFVVFDSVPSLYMLAQDQAAVQRFLFTLGSALFQVGCTTILLTDQNALDTRTTLEAVISDISLLLEVSMVGKREERELRVIKERGAPPLTGKHAFDITRGGIRVYPRIESLPAGAEVAAPKQRVGWGIGALDGLTGGGIPAHDATLVLGTSGIGKTTLALHFVAEGGRSGERCVYLSFHETERRLLRKAAEFGLWLDAGLPSGALRVLHVAPADVDVDRVLHQVLAEVTERQVCRLVIDTLNPLERNASREGRFPEVVSGLVHALRGRGVTTLITREMTQVVGQTLDLSEGREMD